MGVWVGMLNILGGQNCPNHMKLPKKYEIAQTYEAKLPKKYEIAQNFDAKLPKNYETARNFDARSTI